MVLARKFVYTKEYDGMPTNENYEIVEEELPALKDREYLLEAVYLSVDPYMRLWATSLKIGDTMMGSQVAKIIESKSNKFPVGKYVVGNYGWRTHTICKEGARSALGFDHPQILPFGEEYPLSLALGMLGMTGNSAYFGLMEVLKPKETETLVISAAAGAVGSHVGQIAKLKGMTVIGITGSDEKVEWLKSLGFDHVINYKTQDLPAALSEVAPEGIDCYFDNVGGEMTTTILHTMKEYGRVAVCGCISDYNSNEAPEASIIQGALITKQIHMKGFLVAQWVDRWNEGILQNLKWIKEGKIKYRETVTEGFENMVDTLVGVLQGDNIGKAVVKV